MITATTTTSSSSHDAGRSTPNPPETHQKARRHGKVWRPRHWILTRATLQTLTTNLDRGLMTLRSARAHLEAYGVAVPGRTKAEFARCLADAVAPNHAKACDIEPTRHAVGAEVRAMPSASLPLYGRLALERLGADTALRTADCLDELLEGYATAYGLEVDIDVCATCHAAAVYRFVEFKAWEA